MAFTNKAQIDHGDHVAFSATHVPKDFRMHMTDYKPGPGRAHQLLLNLRLCALNNCHVHLHPLVN